MSFAGSYVSAVYICIFVFANLCCPSTIPLPGGLFFWLGSSSKTGRSWVGGLKPSLLFCYLHSGWSGNHMLCSVRIQAKQILKSWRCALLLNSGVYVVVRSSLWWRRDSSFIRASNIGWEKASFVCRIITGRGCVRCIQHLLPFNVQSILFSQASGVWVSSA